MNFFKKIYLLKNMVVICLSYALLLQQPVWANPSTAEQSNLAAALQISNETLRAGFNKLSSNETEDYKKIKQTIFPLFTQQIIDQQISNKIKELESQILILSKLYTQRQLIELLNKFFNHHIDPFVPGMYAGFKSGHCRGPGGSGLSIRS